MNKELTEVQKAYLVLAQTLDKCVTRGALERGDVLNYSKALEILDPVIFEKTESVEPKLDAVQED